MASPRGHVGRARTGRPPGPTHAAPLLLLAMLAAAPAAASPQDVNPFAGLTFRNIGPAVTGGRIHDVHALVSDPSAIWIATATGGIWKTTNRGTTWTPVFDDQPTGTFGVLALAPSDPDVVWAGTGEQNNRQSSSWGNGVYRSTDGGETWSHLGLEETRATGGILVDPTDPDAALVGALGNLWAGSRERGVYRTEDGGRTWDQVLFVDQHTGIVDMERDAADPDLVYAAAYQRLRQPWGFNGGGPGSGIYRSVDGGRSWQLMTLGLPAGDKGRIGIATAPGTGGVVYAVIEHPTEGGIYRSTDRGSTWEQMSDMNSRPMYYSHIYVDPADDQRLYLLTRWFYSSDDGGRTWRTMPTEPTYDVGLKGDYHAMWIDPANPSHFYLAGDGGLYQTWDRGETYVPYENIPIGQFYGLGLDDRSPYWIYGGMQDNHSWQVPSRTRHYLGIVGDDWHEIGFNDGLEHHVDAEGARFVYSNAVGGDLTLVDGYTGDRREILPAAGPDEERLRWEWMTPGVASAVRPGTYYYGAQRLMITRDRGTTWTGTDDLTRDIDRDTLSIMGVRGSEPMISKNDGQSAFSALSAVDESPVDPDVLWAGGDDGSLKVSRDGGATWTDVSRGLRPDGAYISRIDASTAGPGIAYVAVDDHRRGDFRPYAYRTDDFGATWTSIADGLPEDGSVRFVGEHPDRAGALFLGTEHALFASPDRGETWYPLGADLPPTLYMEVEVQPRTHDAVVGTHGRGIFILDDASSIAEWTPEIAAEPAHLFSVRPAEIWQYWENKSYRGQDFWTGENPPEGAIFDYTLGARAPSATLTVTNRHGTVVRTLDGPTDAGRINRVTWDLRYDPLPGAPEDPDSPQARALPRPPRPTSPVGPWVSPGTYTVTLTAGSASATRTFEVRGDPGKPHLTQQQYEERERFLVEVHELQRQLAAGGGRGRGGGGRGRGGALGQLAGLASEFNGRGSVQGSLYPPTAEQRRRLERIKAQIGR